MFNESLQAYPLLDAYEMLKDAPLAPTPMAP